MTDIPKPMTPEEVDELAEGLMRETLHGHPPIESTMELARAVIERGKRIKELEVTEKLVKEGFLTSCYLKKREDDEEPMFINGIPHLDRYAILPLEEYEDLQDELHKLGEENEQLREAVKANHSLANIAGAGLMAKEATRAQKVEKRVEDTKAQIEAFSLAYQTDDTVLGILDVVYRILTGEEKEANEKEG